MIIFILVILVFLFVIIYGTLFIKSLIEELDVKEQLVFNLKRALQEEQNRTMSLNRSLQLLTEKNVS